MVAADSVKDLLLWLSLPCRGILYYLPNLRRGAAGWVTRLSRALRIRSFWILTISLPYRIGFSFARTIWRIGLEISLFWRIIGP